MSVEPVDYDNITYSGEDPKYADTEPTNEKEHAKKVIKGKRKKRTFMQRALYVFTGSNSLKEIVNDVVRETVVPAVQDMVAESIHGITDSMVYGERTAYYGGSRSFNRDRSRRSAPQRDYTAPSKNLTKEGRRYSKKSMIEPVSFDYQNQAFDVLKELDSEIRRSGCVSVAEFYSITGEENIQYSDNYYGWTTVSDCNIRKTKDGWTLFMTDPISISDI